MKLRENSDGGNPTGNFEPGTKLAAELEAVVRSLAGRISVRARGEGAEFQQPTIKIT
jgi:hypothetical protein